jgi:hypothetical protein
VNQLSPRQEECLSELKTGQNLLKIGRTCSAVLNDHGIAAVEKVAQAAPFTMLEVGTAMQYSEIYDDAFNPRHWN